MDFKIFLRNYRKSQKLSVRKFAEILGVSNFRLEKWEKGIQPNYEDGIKIKRYFRVKDFQNFSEEFLETFEPKPAQDIDEVIKLKDMLIDEKDKRIHNLEETIHILMESQAVYQTKKSVSKSVSKS